MQECLDSEGTTEEVGCGAIGGRRMGLLCVRGYREERFYFGVYGRGRIADGRGTAGEDLRQDQMQLFVP